MATKKLTKNQRDELANNLAEGSSEDIELDDLARFYESAMYNSYIALSDRELLRTYLDARGDEMPWEGEQE